MLDLFDEVVGHELQFLFYLIPVLIGTQFAFYFFVQYFRIKDVNLKLNRILLSFGLFTLLIVFGALFLNVQRLFGGESTDVFYRLGWACALSSPVGFLSFIVLDEFSSVMNLKLVKIIMILGLIPIIIVLTIGVSPFFVGSLVFTVLSAYYILGFQIKLIGRTMGNIRKRLKQFFVGEIISLASLPFAVMVGLGIFESPITELVYYSGVAILITGFFIIFLSAYEFPPFYEFEWKDSLLKLYIFHQHNNTILYHSDLAEVVEYQKLTGSTHARSHEEDRDLLFSGGIAGIENVIAKITDSKEKKIYKIQQGNSYILLEYGTDLPITYLLITKKDLISLNHLLKSLKNHFERLFREVLTKTDMFEETQKQIFSTFDTIINIMLEA